MSFLERELERIHGALLVTDDKPTYDQLYAAQQALAWATEPSGAKAPYEMIMDTPGDSGGYSAVLRPSQS